MRKSTVTDELTSVQGFPSTLLQKPVKAVYSCVDEIKLEDFLSVNNMLPQQGGGAVCIGVVLMMIVFSEVPNSAKH